MSMKEIKLQKPLLVNGEEIHTLSYDVEELTINHITRAEALKSKMGGSSVMSVAQTDFSLHVCIGMQAVMVLNPNISEQDLMRLKGYDVTQLAAVGTSFFIPQESLTANNSEKLQEDMQNTITVQ